MRQIFGLLGPRTSRRDEVFAAMAHAGTPRLTPDQAHQQNEVAVGVIGPSTPTSFAASHLQVDPLTGIVGGYLGNAIPREAGIDDANPCWLPRAYAEHGTNLFSRLPDQFVVAIWDPRSHELLLARDRLGQLPLFYSNRGQRVSFASRLPTLLVDGQQDLEIDLHAVSHYLEYKYVPAPRSIYSGINKLPPAHYAVFSAQGVEVKRYWAVAYSPKTAMTLDQAGNHIRSHLLDQASKATTQAAPVGAYLSGGLDSSAVVAALARTSSQAISTFAIGFESASHNELPHARVVAQQYGTNHHELVVTPAALSELDLLVDLFGEPYADASALPSLFAARQAGSQAEVVFTGDGGDETLGGYTRYLMHPSRSNPLMWRGF
ncbi:MAG TPA: asparagine synthase-related protein, partial [Beutenbergiaceae bacterium]|nr:asparagine synthase-related protein [Beutenbergiaceae bacterium]